jgi:glucosylceramidase
MTKTTVYTTVFEVDGVTQSEYVTGLIPDRKDQEMMVVNVYPNKEYQTIEGFGAALTEAAGYALAGISEENRREVVEAYYGENGLGYTIGRIHLDSCDFSISNYCAIENPDDPEFGDFSLERDALYVQPMLRLVEEVHGAPVALLISPWSPPAFMKDTLVRNGGGHLKRDYYQRYADYIAKYITSYRELGFDVRCMTIQNEPLAVQLWDSCEYSEAAEKEFLRDYLYPTLQKKGLSDVAIYIWDHNKERVYERACEIVDETTAGMIEGIAFHWYSGDHFETLQMVREDYPDLKLIHSEGCVELAVDERSYGDDRNHARLYAHDIIGDLNHGMNRWYDWNLVLDEKGGPNHVGNYCGAPIICDTQNDTYTIKPMYFAIGHFSKYIKCGAVRIGCSSYTSEIELTAARNPDGSCVVVMMNAGEERKNVYLRVEGKVAKLVLPGNSISTAVIE